MTLGLHDFVTRRELFVVLVERQLRLRAKRSVFGVIWPVIAPLLLLVLYTFVFGRVFDVPLHDYPVFLFAGLLPWTFLVQSIHDGLQSISFEPDLVRRAPFPYVFLPLARVVVMAIPFLALLVVFAVYSVATDHMQVEQIPLLVIPVFSVVVIVATLTMLLALVDVFNRDIRYVLNNIITVWFFLAPIVYTKRMTEQHLRFIAWMDPMAWVIRQFQQLFYWGGPISVATRCSSPGRVDRDLARDSWCSDARRSASRSTSDRPDRSSRRPHRGERDEVSRSTASRVRPARRCRGSTRSHHGKRAGRVPITWGACRTNCVASTANPPTPAPPARVRRASPLPGTAPGRCGPRRRAATRCAAGSTGSGLSSVRIRRPPGTRTRRS